jgi:hypothetical protein
MADEQLVRSAPVWAMPLQKKSGDSKAEEIGAKAATDLLNERKDDGSFPQPTEDYFGEAHQRQW